MKAKVKEKPKKTKGPKENPEHESMSTSTKKINEEKYCVSIGGKAEERISKDCTEIN